MASRSDSLVKAVLGPTNTGKTHYAIERLCGHSSGMMGFPLRLLAREVYDRVVALKGVANVGLMTGEEKIMPPDARWILCTMESLPTGRDVAFVGLDEVQLGGDADRGHVFTDRLLNARGREETVILGSATIRPLVRELVPEAEIITRPRFSQLSFAGAKKLSRLPPRTAVIAFSADEVYAIAEVLRRTRGGAAIVMGNLSPRTRNAQVAMYQAGEVDFLVATDAIGMGLNMDIDHVAFASLAKFDGTRRRRLSVTEMAQIAGRAGRHQRDGSFGLALGERIGDGFSEEEIERIEEHRFRTQGFLHWRNSDLEAGNIDDLLERLEAPPPYPLLRPAPVADDLAVLKMLAGFPEFASLASDQWGTERLWQLCGLPDFRSVGPEFHARLVARLCRHLLTPEARIPNALIGDEIARLDVTQGDIATISSRLATIRTWTYAANRPDWVEDAPRWAARARDVEQRLSDMLHARLTERFVDRKLSALLRRPDRVLGAHDFALEADGTVTALDEPMGRIRGLAFVAEPETRSDSRRRFLSATERWAHGEVSRRAVRLIGDESQFFALRMEPGEAIRLTWRGDPIALLTRGRDLLAPVIAPEPAIQALEPKLRDDVRRKLNDEIGRIIARKLGPLVMISTQAYAPSTPPALRAFLAGLAMATGVAPRSSAGEQLEALDAENRRAFARLGFVAGSLTLFHPGLLKPDALCLRLALLAVHEGTPMPPVPMPGLGLLDRPSAELGKAAQRAGFVRFGDRLLRADLVERIARSLHDQRRGHQPFAPDRTMATSLGIGEPTLAMVMRALGFVALGGEGQLLWKWRGLRPVSGPRRRRQRGARKAA